MLITLSFLDVRNLYDSWKGLLFLLMFGLSAAFQRDMPTEYHRLLLKCKIHSSSDEFGPTLIDLFLLARELDKFRLVGQVHKLLPKSTCYPKVILEIASSLHLKHQTCWGRSDTGISMTILDRTPSINNKNQKKSHYQNVSWEAKSPHIFFSCRIQDYGDVSDQILTDNCGVMCLVCVLFSSTADVQAATGSFSNFIGKPFNNYKQGSCLNDHSKSPTHTFCLQMWKDVIANSAPPKPVTDVRLGFVPHNAVAKAGREILLSIVLHIARQGIALRGSVVHSNADVKACIVANRASNTTISLQSCGNFLATVIFASSLSQDLNIYFQKTSLSALWLSPSCQNRMLHYLANNIREYNNQKIKDAKFFCVMFDESQNLAKNSILAVAERYYDRLQRAPVEVITSYLQLPKQNADTIAKVLIRQIERNLSVRGLPDSAFVSCTADGCGTNTGCNLKGVIAQLKRRFGKQLIFIWYHLHRLNLVLMHSLCLNETETRLLSIVMSNNVKACDELIRWINFSTKRNSDFALTCQSMDYIEVTLKELCRTRWIERILGIQVFTAYIACIVQFLWNMVHKASDAEYSSKDKGLAMSFLKGIQTYPFLLSLIVFRDLICLYEPMTKELQGVRVDLPRARRAARSILQIIREYRTVKLDQFCNTIFHNTEAICSAARSKAEIDSKMFHIQAVPPRCAVRSVYRANHRPENYTEMTMKERCELFYRDSLIIPILDRMQEELLERFENPDAVEVWDLAIACSPYDQIRDLLNSLPDNQIEKLAFQRARFEKDLLPFTTVVTRGGTTASSSICVSVPLLQKWKAALVAGVARFRNTLCDLNNSEITAIVLDPTGGMLVIEIDNYIAFWLHQSTDTLFDTRDMAENLSFMEARGLLCPVIVSLTMIILSCAATSVTPERGFSSEHFISTKFRTRTKIGRLSNLVMLYSNSRIPIDLAATHKKTCHRAVVRDGCEPRRFQSSPITKKISGFEEIL